jgi:hypothetical protein
MQYSNETAVATVKKSPVALRREMVGNATVMGALTPVERAVFLASTAKTIAEITPAELTSELRTALKWICKDVGYRVQDEADSQYLIIRTAEILKRYYSNLTLKDFRMAFEMSITGQLDEYLPRTRDGKADRGHYQQFNAEYVCKILDAYMMRRGAVLKKAFDAVETPELKPGDDKKQEYRNEAIKELYEAFDDFRETGRLNTSAVTDLVFWNILSEHGLVVPVNVTPEEQKQVWQRTINDFARRGMVGDVNELKQNGINDPRLEHGSFVLARHKALGNIFSGLIEQGKSVKEIVK